MDSKQFEAKLADAEMRLKRLRSLYEQWFHGLERLEPQPQRRDFDRLITELRRAQPRNTALRFRFTQVVQRYTTYSTYWRRIARQIEEGTYKRDVLRARRLVAGPQTPPDGTPQPDAYELDLDIDIEAVIDQATASEPPPSPAAGVVQSGNGRAARLPARPPSEITPFAHPDEAGSRLGTGRSPTPARSFPAPAGVRPGAAPPAAASAFGRPVPPPPPARGAGAPPPRSAAGGNSMSDAQIKRIYERYVDARRTNSERTDNVKIESVARTVRNMMPKLQQKHGGKKIDFEVVVRDGKVALKPVAK